MTEDTLAHQLNQTPMAEPGTRLAKIEQRLGTEVLSETTANIGGVKFASVLEMMEFAKLMSLSLQGVPAHCRGQPGLCLAILNQALDWRMSPYAVAQKSYVVNDRIAYESQLIHAVIEARAPIQGRLRHEFLGEGDERRCRVWAVPIGETDILEYTSPMIKQITVKNSPLWKSKPDVQLYYNASRDFARIYFPDVILGVYSEEEMEGVAADRAAATPQSTNLLERLPGRVEGAGMAAGNVDRGLNGNDNVEDATIIDEADVPQGGQEGVSRETPGTGHLAQKASKSQNRPRSAGSQAAGKAAGAVKPSGPASDTPSADKAASAPKSQPARAKPSGRDWSKKPPTNPNEYKAYVIDWLPTLNSGSAISERFSKERKMRNDCGMVAEETAYIKELINERLKQIG